MNATRSAAGPAILLSLVAVYPVVWLIARPAGQPTLRFAAEICGAEALLLLSCTLVLATLLTPIERAFGGLDRVAVWHRGAATAAVVLLVPHISFVGSTPDAYETTFGHGLGDVAFAGLLVLTVWALAPKLRTARWPGPVRALARTSYERWLTAHRLTGLFVVVAVAHAAIVDPVLHRSETLRVFFIIVGGVGIAAYVYREVFARFVIPIYDYTVAEVRRPSATVLDVVLEPAGKRLAFTPGQFVAIAFGGENGWQRHPFSIASAPHQHQLEVGIKAAGDYTSRLRDKLRPGTPAKLAGPFGGFDYRLGGRDQVWIAGGIGITPFVSWLRSLDRTFEQSVDFYCSIARRSDELYGEDLAAAAAAHPSLRIHLAVTEESGRLTAAQTLEGQTPDEVSIYMCGPPPMMHSFDHDFRRMGVPRNHIRWEQFDIR